ncbi:hypothetical protein PIB30_098479 [Stylosanthes scabra]|uniref:Uncharacterized protein n=1 Tax=Stylosanthes scabra TaxID=79078 RepID=A0ABU6TX67_9FABA|nr:hypothetical protein [Stylosanthes scabra]
MSAATSAANDTWRRLHNAVEHVSADWARWSEERVGRRSTHVGEPGQMSGSAEQYADPMATEASRGETNKVELGPSSGA